MHISGYNALLVALAVLAVSWLLGYYLSRAIRMPDYSWKLFVIFLALLGSAMVLVSRWPPKLGIDLSGGLMMVYEVDQAKKPKEGVDMEKLIDAVKKRIDPSGVKEVTVLPYGVEMLEIIIPNVNDPAEVEQIKQRISRIGTLEFRILANNRDNRDLFRLADANPDAKELRDSEGHVLGFWVPVAKDAESQFLRNRDIKTRVRKEPGKGEATEVLVFKDDYNVTGDYLISERYDASMEGHKVLFGFNSAGATRFGGLTGDHLPEPDGSFSRQLGIILDGNLTSAPSLRAKISDAGEITGIPSQKEAEATVAVLKAGSLPAALNKDPISEILVGPTLGEDTIRRSTHAMIISAILVPLFMLWYYRFAGMVANICLVLNMVLLVAIMIMVDAAFTLTGLAGLALAVGMAVDNNVLLYERMREELHRGAAMRMAIRNAFHRVGVVIVDANLTHIIAATVLYVVGSEQVKSFAVTFLLGAILSLWTSLFVARWVFEIAEKKRWLTKLKMLHVIGDTQIDFMAWFPAAATFSVLITVAGLFVAFHRGQGILDIDFTGGVAIQTVFRNPQEVATVRDAMERSGLRDVAVSDIRSEGNVAGKSKDFMINTSVSNKEEVQEKLREAFGDKLKANSVKVSPVAAVTAPKPAPAPAKPSAKAVATPPAKPASKEEKPAPKAEKPKPKEEKPAEKHARNDLPPESMLALAGPLAPADVQPAATDKAKAVAPGDAKQSSAAAAKAPAAATALPATRPAEASAGTATPAVEDPYLGGSQTKLEFDLKVSHQTAKDMVTRALEANEEALKIRVAQVPFELTNPEYSEGDAPYKSWNLKIKLPPEKTGVVLATLKQQVKATPYFPSVSTIGGAVARGTQIQAVEALVASWTLIIIYLWIRFQGVAFGLAAVIALIHDVLVMLGAIAFSYYIAPFCGWLMIEPFKINLPIVAAFLTIIGYSVNDTIVVFDRIREVRGKDPRMTRQMVNDSTNQTLSRTLLTSFTVMLVVFILYVAGGEAIHGFAFALLIGVLTGTYSSIYVAAPILLWLIHPKEMRR